MAWYDWVMRPEVGWVAGGAMMVLAAIVLYVAPRDRVLRAFSSFLVLRGLANLPPILDPIQGLQVDNVLVIVLPFAALWFLIEYHRRARLLRPSAWTLPVLAGTAVALVVLWHAEVRMPDWLHIVNIMFRARFLAYAAVVFVLAYDALHRAAAERWPLLLISGVFALNPLYYCAILLRDNGIVALLRSEAFFVPHVVALLATVLICATPIYLLVALARGRSVGLRRPVTAYGAACLAVLLVVLYFVVRYPAGAVGFHNPAMSAVDRLTTLPVPFIVGYVLLRHNLFDLDLRLKASLPAAVILGACSGLFFVVQESLEDRIEAGGTLYGLVAAGFLSLAFFPLHRGIRRITDRLMPGVERTADYVAARKRDVYRTAVETTILDDQIRPRERAFLDTLSQELGLSVEDARGVEAGVLARRREAIVAPAAVAPAPS